MPPAHFSQNISPHLGFQSLAEPVTQASASRPPLRGGARRSTWAIEGWRVAAQSATDLKPHRWANRPFARGPIQRHGLRT